MTVRQFLDWVERAPAGRQAEAAFGLGRAFLHSASDEDARVAMEAAITVLLDSPQADVRFALADALAASPKSPRHVIITLAGDQPHIATLVLSRSPLLIDAELVELASAASPPLQMAIAKRPIVSPTVAMAIAESSTSDACMALVENRGAEIGRAGFARVAERFGEDAEMREALLRRVDLPSEVHHMLVRYVGNILENMITARSWVSDARAKMVTREACDRATVVIAADTETDDLPALVEHLRVTGQLTTALLLRAVCAGNIDFFEASLAALAGVPPSRVASLVRAGRTAALRAIYAKADLPQAAFDAFVRALEIWRRIAEAEEQPDSYRFTRQIVDAVIACCAETAANETRELAAMLRRFAADQAREAAHTFARASAA